MDKILPSIIFIVACLLFLLLRRRNNNVTTFKQLDIFKYDAGTTRDDIRKVLMEFSAEEQLQVGMADDTNSEYCQQMLVQHKYQSADFLVCYMRPHSSSAWETMDMESLVELIYSHRENEECSAFEKWTLVTPAIEGKAFGEY